MCEALSSGGQWEGDGRVDRVREKAKLALVVNTASVCEVKRLSLSATPGQSESREGGGGKDSGQK